jgi:phospholipase C
MIKKDYYHLNSTDHFYKNFPKGKTFMKDHPFEHFVVLMMENQSFDRLYGYIDGIGKLKEGHLVSSSSSKPLAATPGLHPVEDQVYDPPHSTESTMAQLWGDTPYKGQKPNGTGWINSHLDPECKKAFVRCCDEENLQLPAMTELAKNYVVCDRNFSAMPGPTAPNRLFLHAATSNGYTGGTWKPEDGLDMPPEVESIFEALDHQDPSLGWNLYNLFPNMTTPLAFPYVREHRERVKTFEEFKEDCSNDNLPAYSIINPNLFVNCMHAGQDGSTLVDGDNFVASVYEALRANSTVWEKTLFFITFDEAGGYWDSVINTESQPELNHVPRHDKWMKDDGPEYDFKYLGVRIPGLLISPWLDHAVESTTFEHSSVPATVKKIFNSVGRGPDGFLTPRDQAANDLISHLKLRDTPRTDLSELPRSNYNQSMLEARAEYAKKKSNS